MIESNQENRSITECLARWIATKEEQHLDAFYELLQSVGRKAAMSPSLRGKAQDGLRHEGFTVVEKWMLLRVASGRAPTYSEYTGEALLRTILADADALVMMANAAEFVSELLAALLVEDVLMRFEGRQRQRIEERVSKLLDQVQDVQFLAGPRASFNGSALSVPQLVGRLFVPESGVPEEMIFVRIVQATDAVFLAVAALLTAARQAIALGDLPHGLLYLDRALLFARTLQPLAGANRLIHDEAWLSLRPLIIEPSAIQGQNFPRLAVELKNLTAEAQRILQHPRVPEDRRAWEPLLTELLSEIHKAVKRWHDAHGPMAASKNGPKSDGAVWLMAQRNRPWEDRSDEDASAS